MRKQPQIGREMICRSIMECPNETSSIWASIVKIISYLGTDILTERQAVRVTVEMFSLSSHLEANKKDMFPARRVLSVSHYWAPIRFRMRRHAVLPMLLTVGSILPPRNRLSVWLQAVA